MVEQASPWNDQQRARMLGLVKYRDGCCPGCGMHESIASDPDNVMVPDKRVCPFCVGLDVHKRVVKAADEEYQKSGGDKQAPKKPRPWDGRHLFIRPATPKELAEREQRRPGKG